MLWYIVNFLSSGALRDYKTVEDLFSETPPPGETYWIIDWADDSGNKPVFPQWSKNDLNKKKTPTSWGNDASNWAKRAGLIFGLGLHAARREILIKLNGESPALIKAIFNWLTVIRTWRYPYADVEVRRAEQLSRPW